MKLKSILLSVAACSLFTQSAIADNSCDYTIPNIGEFCWNELATSNVQEAKNFYGNVFGWRFTDHEIGNFSYTVIEADVITATGGGVVELGGICQIPADLTDQIPSQWISYLQVKDIEESLREATNRGATVVRPVTTVGYFMTAVIKDPKGACIGLCQTILPKE